MSHLQSASREPIGYIGSAIPEFDIPAYEGVWYDAPVPDTLDLQERATWAVNGLTEPTDPAADYEIYWQVSLKHNPVVMQHDWQDMVQCKFLEALPLMRLISGSELNPHIERRWMETLLLQLGPDGLAYTPVRGRPWARLASEHYGVRGDADQQLNPFYSGRLLSVMSIYQLRDRGTFWAEKVRRMVDGLVQRAEYEDQVAFYWPSCLHAEEGRPAGRASIPRAPVNCEIRSIPLGLVHAYRVTGYEPALPLARKVIAYIRGFFFDDQARFLSSAPANYHEVHFHAHTAALLAMVEYALVSGDQELLEFATRGYEYAKANGEVFLGYFPEHLGNDELEHSELCEVADMVAVGLKLTEAGVGDYLDDVDRWTRNMLAAGQLSPSDAEWLRLYAAGECVSAADLSYQTVDWVLERNIGAFAGWPKANDWYAGVGPGIMHCCTRALYYVWEDILRHENGRLRVNLLLNRASPWADVDSHLPYVGRVDVKVKEPVSLSVRIPEWTEPAQVLVRVNGVPREVSWQARYAQVGDVTPGDIATLTFPIAERTDTVWVEKEQYTLVRKGNDVVAISPPGRCCPLYRREHYRVNVTRWTNARRFISTEQMRW